MLNKSKVKYVPCKQEYWVSCKFGFNSVKKTGFGYDWDTKPMEELPKDLQDFRYNAKYTIKEFHQHVGEHYNDYAKAGKVEQAFDNLKTRIDVYNEVVRNNSTDLYKSVERADSFLAWTIREQRENLQKQIMELRSACIGIGVKHKLIAALLDQPENNLRLRTKVLLKAKDLELALPTVEVPTLEPWQVADLQGYVKYDPDSAEAPTKYTEEELARAPKKERAIRWTQDVTNALKPLQEDILILMTLYITQVDDGGDAFLRRDEFGDVIERDNDPAPTTYEEYKAWELKIESERVVKFYGTDVDYYKR